MSDKPLRRDTGETVLGLRVVVDPAVPADAIFIPDDDTVAQKLGLPCKLSSRVNDSSFKLICAAFERGCFDDSSGAIDVPAGMLAALREMDEQRKADDYCRLSRDLLMKLIRQGEQQSS